MAKPKHIEQTAAADEGEEERPMMVVVNGKRKRCASGNVTAQDIIRASFDVKKLDPDKATHNVPYVVQFMRGPKDNESGVLEPGKKMAVTRDMIFKVIHPDDLNEDKKSSK